MNSPFHFPGRGNVSQTGLNRPRRRIHITQGSCPRRPNTSLLTGDISQESFHGPLRPPTKSRSLSMGRMSTPTSQMSHFRLPHHQLAPHMLTMTLGTYRNHPSISFWNRTELSRWRQTPVPLPNVMLVLKIKAITQQTVSTHGRNIMGRCPQKGICFHITMPFVGVNRWRTSSGTSGIQGARSVAITTCPCNALSPYQFEKLPSLRWYRWKYNICAHILSMIIGKGKMERYL